MLESVFKKKLVRKLYDMFPGCIVIHTDPNDIQGMTDLIILYENKWASLEVKDEENASHQPNQDYYVDRMNKMSFSAFIYPQNEKEVLHALQRSFRSHRPTRISIRK